MHHRIISSATASVIIASATNANVADGAIVDEAHPSGFLRRSASPSSRADGVECIPSLEWSSNYHSDDRRATTSEEGASPDLGVLSPSGCPNPRHTCVSDASSSLGGRCRDAALRRPKAATRRSARGGATRTGRRSRRDLQGDNFFVPGCAPDGNFWTGGGACPDEFCACVEGMRAVGDCAPEIHHVCTTAAAAASSEDDGVASSSMVSTCWGERYASFYEEVYCKEASCYLDGEKGYDDCRCSYYEDYCAFYSHLVERYPDVAVKCMTAACCEKAVTRDEKAVCLPGIPDAPPAPRSSGGTSGSVESATPDLFLMSGQSNMNGHTTSGQSLTGDDSYWLKLKSILSSGVRNDEVLESALLAEIFAGHTRRKSGQEWVEGVSTTLANETMRLYKRGLLNDLDTPLSLGRCSFLYPQDSGKARSKSRGTTPTVWDARCGTSFGHELMFSRTLELEMDQSNSFEMVKVAADGTQIFKYWYPGFGAYWTQLRDTIRSRKGNWQGFIWHQGTQEAHKGEDTSLTYLGNLTGLIEEVRAEMFEGSVEGYWQCKEEIPVVVVQIGYWPQNERARRVREAQARFCDEDPRAELVVMDDLSRFFHFDATSFLIGGSRIAMAWQAALQNTTLVCSSESTSQTPAASTKQLKFCPSLSKDQCSGGCTWVDDGVNSWCRSGRPPSASFWIPSPSATPATDVSSHPSADSLQSVSCIGCENLTAEDCRGCSSYCYWSTLFNTCEQI